MRFCILILTFILSFHEVVFAASEEQYQTCLSKASDCDLAKDPSLDIFKALCESQRKELGCGEMYKHASPDEQEKFYSCEEPNSLCDHLGGIRWERTYQCAEGVGAVIVDSVYGIYHLPEAIWEMIKKVPEIPASIRECYDNFEAKKAFIGALKPADMTDESIEKMSCSEAKQFARQKVNLIMHQLEQRRQNQMATTGRENLRYFEMKLTDSEVQALNFDNKNSGVLRKMSCYRPEERARTACEELAKVGLGVGGGAVASYVSSKLVVGLPKLVRVWRAEKAVGQKLTPEQKLAVQEAHEVGTYELGADGKTLAAIDNYTKAQLKKKAQALQEAGFNVDERRALIEKGIVGEKRIGPSKPDVHGFTKEELVKIKELYKKYPQLAAKIEDMENLITEGVTLRNPKETLNISRTYYSKAVNKLEDLPFGPAYKKYFPDDPKIRQALVYSYNDLNNVKAFSLYLKKVAYDAALQMEKWGHATEDLKAGKISRGAIKTVLVDRYKERGMRVGKIYSSDPQTFRTRLKEGPFLDYGADEMHGEFAHLAQLDYLHNRVSKATGGDMNSFYKYLSSANGHKLWFEIFDTMTNSSYATRPELIEVFFTGIMK